MNRNDDIDIRFALPLLPILLLYGELWPLAEKLVIRTEDIIAYTSDYSLAFFLPMGLLMSVLVFLLVKKIIWSKRRNNIHNPFIKVNAKERKRNKIKFSVIFMLLFVICSVLMCTGILQRTVITPDYTIKSYNFVGQESEQYKPEDINFVKIYPEAYYARYGGFEDIHAVIEIYINENDCFRFTNKDFDSFDKLIAMNSAIKSENKKIYIADKAANEPDPEEDSLSKDDLLLIENFYKQYEKLK